MNCPFKSSLLPKALETGQTFAVGEQTRNIDSNIESVDDATNTDQSKWQNISNSKLRPTKQELYNTGVGKLCPGGPVS